MTKNQDLAPSIIHQDRDLIVVNKPPGLPVHATRDPNRPHMEGLVRDRLSEQGVPNDLWVVHRLDAWTSGVVAMARTPKARRHLAHAFENREVHKVYEAICVGIPDEPNGRLKHYLARRRRDGREVMEPVRSGGKVAITDYRLLASSGQESLSLVRFEPVTGRTHQIRVQAAAAGWPIVGDRLYGQDYLYHRSDLQGQLLHARSLSLALPDADPLTFDAPPPPTFQDWASRL